MDLWDCALGFMDSQMLLTAHDLGVFEALAGDAGTPAEVASRVGIPEDSAERLLVGLCALEIIRREPDGRFENGPEASRKLVRDEPEYMGDMFRHVQDDLYPLWEHFRSALEEGEAQWDRAFEGDQPRNEAMHEDPESRRAFHEGMHVIAHGAAEELASYAPELGELRTVVDIGGSTGGFLIALAETFPDLEGIVFDLPGVEAIAERHFQEAGMDGRLRFEGGDFFNDPFPENADAYGLGFILHDWDDETGRRLVEKISDASEPGARLIVGEYLLNDEKTGPRWVARSSLNMLVAAQGRERTAEEYVELVSPFGFELDTIYMTSKGKNFMIFDKA